MPHQNQQDVARERAEMLGLIKELRALVNQLGESMATIAQVINTVLNTPPAAHAPGQLYVLSGGTPVGAAATITALQALAAAQTPPLTLNGTLDPVTPLNSPPTGTVTTPPAFGAPSQLAFTQQPTAAAVGAVISPAVTVTVQDKNGVTVANNTDTITLTIASGPSNIGLGGTVSVAAVAGVATFPNLTLSAAGTIMLKATDGALTVNSAGVSAS